MLSTSRLLRLVAVLAAVEASQAMKLPSNDRPQVFAKPMIKRGLSDSHDIDISQTFGDEVLLNTKSSSPSIGTDIAVVCNNCCIQGAITAAIVDGDDGSVSVDPTLRLELTGVSANLDISLATSGEASFSIPLLSSSLAKLGFADANLGIDIGIQPDLELLVTVDGPVDIDTGFSVSLSDTSYLEASLIDGLVTQYLFDDATAKKLPVVVHDDIASANVTVSLRFRTNVGVTLPGDSSQSGVFINIGEATSQLGAKKDASCELQAEELVNVNVGAFAKLNADANAEFAFAPTGTTTLYAIPQSTGCAVASGESPTARTAELSTVTSCPKIEESDVDVASYGVVRDSFDSLYKRAEGDRGKVIKGCTAATATNNNCPADKAFEVTFTKTSCGGVKTNAQCPSAAGGADAKALVDVYSTDSEELSVAGFHGRFNSNQDEKCKKGGEGKEKPQTPDENEDETETPDENETETPDENEIEITVTVTVDPTATGKKDDNDDGPTTTVLITSTQEVTQTVQPTANADSDKKDAESDPEEGSDDDEASPPKIEYKTEIVTVDEEVTVTVIDIPTVTSTIKATVTQTKTVTKTNGAAAESKPTNTPAKPDDTEGTGDRNNKGHDKDNKKVDNKEKDEDCDEDEDEDEDESESNAKEEDEHDEDCTSLTTITTTAKTTKVTTITQESSTIQTVTSVSPSAATAVVTSSGTGTVPKPSSVATKPATSPSIVPAAAGNLDVRGGAQLAVLAAAGALAVVVAMGM